RSSNTRSRSFSNSNKRDSLRSNHAQNSASGVFAGLDLNLEKIMRIRSDSVAMPPNAKFTGGEVTEPAGTLLTISAMTLHARAQLYRRPVQRLVGPAPESMRRRPLHIVPSERR